MRFLKQHYEKIILSLVLAGLAVAAAWLPMALNETRQRLQATSDSPPAPKPFKPADLTNTDLALRAIQAPPPLELSGEHNLFNPVVWKKRYDGTLIKIATGKEEGPDALTILKITPLHFTISYDRSTAQGYFFNVAREVAADPRKRAKRPLFVSALTANEYFKLKGVTGTPEEPSIKLEILDVFKEEATISPSHPFDRIEGYTIDLRYDLEKLSWNDQRLNAILTFAGEKYKIVYIDKNEVRVMANSNNKQTTIKWNRVP